MHLKLAVAWRWHGGNYGVHGLGEWHSLNGPVYGGVLATGMRLAHPDLAAWADAGQRQG